MQIAETHLSRNFFNCNHLRDRRTYPFEKYFENPPVEFDLETDWKQKRKLRVSRANVSVTHCKKARSLNYPHEVNGNHFRNFQIAL